MEPKRVLKALLHDWGIDVYLQRKIFPRGTGVYGLPEGGDTKENYYTHKLELWTVRYSYAARKMSLPHIEIDRPEGLAHAVNLVIYWTADAKPTEGDRVYIGDDRYSKNFTTHIIKYAQPVTGWHGEVTYYESGCSRELPT